MLQLFLMELEYQSNSTQEPSLLSRFLPLIAFLNVTFSSTSQGLEYPSGCIVKFRDVSDMPIPLGKPLVMKSCDGEPTQNTWDKEHTYTESLCGWKVKFLEAESSLRLRSVGH